MKLLNFFTRGGQIAVHQYRMLRQILTVSISLALLLGLAAYFGYMYVKTTSYQRYLYKEHLYAEFMVNMSLNNPEKAQQEFQFQDGRTRTVQSEWVLKNPDIKKHIDYIDNLSYIAALKGSMAGAAIFLFVISFFIIRGYRQSLKKLERGGEVVTGDVLAKIIKRRNLDSDLTLDKLPLIKDKETSHILITGTTGSGKTNCFHTLLPQIRQRPNKALIVDLTGDFVAKYYREGKDVLLNPLDARTVNWSPWADCLTDSHYDSLAAAIIPKSSNHDKFWENAGKALLSSALRKLAEEDNKDPLLLYYLLVRVDLGEFCKFFRHTEAASYTHIDGEKMTLSIRATLANHIQSFKLLNATEDVFSVRQWVNDPSNDSWLFISAKPDQRETLLPLISGWVDIAINSLMSSNPDPSRRFWFVLDELPALQKLPSLETGLAESRKYGGCFLAGVQSFPQLTNTYGQNQAQSILDLFNTKIFFRNTDPNTTAWISKVLGEAEIKEQVENLSYGANTMRDGVSLSEQTKTKPLVLPTEIATLVDLEAFIRLPEALPVARIKMNYKNVKFIVSLFIPFIRKEGHTEKYEQKDLEVSTNENEVIANILS